MLLDKSLIEFVLAAEVAHEALIFLIVEDKLIVYFRPKLASLGVFLEMIFFDELSLHNCTFSHFK